MEAICLADHLVGAVMVAYGCLLATHLTEALMLAFQAVTGLGQERKSEGGLQAQATLLVRWGHGHDIMTW